MDLEKVEYEKLSDKELIQRHCKNKEDQAPGDELWRRHQQTVYESLQKCGRTLCPAFYDARDLAHDSYLQAPKNLLARICEFTELDSARSLLGWLKRVARSTMLDERRKVTDSRRKNKIVKVSIERPSGEEHGESTSPEVTEETFMEIPEVEPEPSAEVEEAVVLGTAGPVSFEETFESRSDYLYFRSLYSTSPLDPSAPIEWEGLEKERKVIFREVLTRHAQQSDEDATCAAIIRLRYWRRLPVAKIVERVYGQPETERQRQTKHRAYYRLLDKDYEAIAAELKRTLGVVRPEQI